jgi:hypothetical protein
VSPVVAVRIEERAKVVGMYIHIYIQGVPLHMGFIVNNPSVKTKCHFKKRHGGKKSEIQCPKFHFKRVLSKAEYIRRVEDEKRSPLVVRPFL